VERDKRVQPGPGQESVWDYPRPPRLERTERRVRVVFGGRPIADTCSAIRCLETSHPPGYYIPLDDVATEHLVPTDRTTVCEFKGRAHYYDVQVSGRTAPNAVWEYPEPHAGYEDLEGCVAFYPALTECWVDEERVEAQDGDFYGGWITSDVVGPFKGAPGTSGW